MPTAVFEKANSSIKSNRKLHIPYCFVYQLDLKSFSCKKTSNDDIIEEKIEFWYLFLSDLLTRWLFAVLFADFVAFFLNFPEIVFSLKGYL
jgi:hypothetical protein